MRQLLIFLCLIVLSLQINMNPINLEEISEKQITVSIDGEVENPGTYELDRYATISDLLMIASAKETSDLSTINENTILKDNDKLIVPKISEQKKISINTSSLNELILLPGIGEATAQRIIDYRNENGLFQSIEELQKVKGIGEKKYAALEELICL